MVYVAAMAEALRKPAVGCLSDFRTFVMRGNVLDLAVAVIIGGAFNSVVNTLVTGIITPAVLNPALRAANISDISQLSYNGILYGSFLAAVFSFFIISVVLFLIVKAFEKSRREFVRMVLNDQEDTPTELADVQKPGENDVSAVETQQQLLSAIKDLTHAIHGLANKDTDSKRSSESAHDAIRPMTAAGVRLSPSLSDPKAKPSSSGPLHGIASSLKSE